MSFWDIFLKLVDITTRVCYNISCNHNKERIMQERFETFTVLIANLARSIHRIKTEEMAEFDLKSSHVSCIYYLFKLGSMTAKELCDACNEDKANISRSIRYLEANGYVYCESSAQKRYLDAFCLTEKGREIGARISEKKERILDLVGEGIADADREIMYRSLAIIDNNLKKVCADYESDQKKKEDANE